MKPHQTYRVEKIRDDVFHVVKCSTRRIALIFKTEALAELVTDELNAACLECYIDGQADACRENREQPEVAA